MQQQNNFDANSLPLPYSWGFGKPLTEEEFKALHKDDNSNVRIIKQRDILKGKLRESLNTKVIMRSPSHIRDNVLKKQKEHQPM